MGLSRGGGEEGGRGGGGGRVMERGRGGDGVEDLNTWEYCITYQAGRIE